MKRSFIYLLTLSFMLISLTSCGRRIRTAQDITPGNCPYTKLDWRYGAGDIQIQTSKLGQELMNRWFAKTGWSVQNGKPRMIITEVDNRTDLYISTDMIRDIYEEVAINDGRYTVVVGNTSDRIELDQILEDINYNPKYSNKTRAAKGNVTAPQFLAKVRITKAVTKDRWFDYEDYRMTITLYDIETQEAIDSAYDVLRKKVQG